MLEDLININKESIDRLKKAGIDSIEKLALKKVEDLLKIQGFTIMSAVTHIQEAIDFLNSKDEEAIVKEEEAIIKDDPHKTLKHLSTNVLNKLDLEESTVKNGPQKAKPAQKSIEKKTPAKKPIKKKKKVEESVKKKRPVQKVIEKKVPTPKPVKTKTMTKEPKIELDIGYIKDLFPEEIVMRIRFLHFKLKKLEFALEKPSENVSYDDLGLISEYIDLININYKTKNQNLVIKELAIATSYFDPIDNCEIEIYDLMFESARACWVIARLYANLSKKFEKLEDLDNAIISMIKSSKMYKSAACFSAAAVYQNKIGKSLEPKNLEFESEQSRIFAQSIVAKKEEKENNLILASKLYAGLSLLSMRLLYLGFDDEKIKKQLSAQADFDMGIACYLQAQALQKREFSESSDEQTQPRLIEDLSKKAVYYFSKSEKTWEQMIKNLKNLEEQEKGNILFNLSVVNDNIMEIDAEILPYKLIKDISNPEPYIAVPENLAEILPRTTLYLSNIKPMDVNVEIYRKYMKKNLEIPNPVKKREDLLSKKTSIGRTLKQLKSLYDDNDIDIYKYTELYEKYTKKLNDIELEIQKLG